MLLSHLTEGQPVQSLSKSGDFLIIWIPAFAGMTQFLLMDYLG
ncbi:hypothetical protein GALL_162700 [mine drainage metagenome]|uniref:Uncharacterized protein n=1 Tax=mine drainage metagenome TaxID=410659 RepID=A0A1J5S044_9ZZZZ